MFVSSWKKAVSCVVFFSTLCMSPPDAHAQAEDWVDVSGVLHAPDKLSTYAMAYDAARQQCVMYSGTLWPEAVSRTWLWDGKRWDRVQPSQSPPVLEGHSMAYDAARKQVVLFGGASTQGDQSETWLWDGATWRQALTSKAPSPRIAHRMVYDSSRQEVFLFGGWTAGRTLRDAWVWNGITWKEVKTTRPLWPSVEAGFSMAYDGARMRVVIFGWPTVNPSAPQTWTWDGLVWNLEKPASAPGGRCCSEMVNDPIAKRVVLFGGRNSSSAKTADTWTWDGKDWRRLLPSKSPPGRDNHVMAYDAARKCVVVFGGYSSNPRGNQQGGTRVADTWTWNGNTWALAQADGSVFPIQEHAMAYDSVRREVVMFGGRSSYRPQGDTMIWNGDQWATKSQLSIEPPPREQHAMAYDAKRKEVVLFGGVDASRQGAFGDTWLWDGKAWRKANPSLAPRARIGHSMAFDAAHGQVVLFGGSDGAGRLADTWTWDGSNWSLQKTAAAPSPRSGHAMAYDPVQKQVVLFGGADLVGRSAETWTWNGSKWTPRLLISTFPAAREGHAMVYDMTSLQVILFGGANQTPSQGFSDLWTWDGKSWTQKKPARMPPGRGGHAMAFDAARQQTVLHGGASFPYSYSDTWLYGTPRFVARFDHFGSGCGPSPMVTLSASKGSKPLLGASFVMQVQHAPVVATVAVLSLGGSRTFLNAFRLPFALDSMGMPGCRLYQSHDATRAFSLRQGTGQFALPIPNDPGLVGESVHLQALISAPRANAAQVLTTNAATLVFGTH